MRIRQCYDWIHPIVTYLHPSYFWKFLFSIRWKLHLLFGRANWSICTAGCVRIKLMPEHFILLFMNSFFLIWRYYLHSYRFFSRQCFFAGLPSITEAERMDILLNVKFVVQVVCVPSVMRLHSARYRPLAAYANSTTFEHVDLKEFDCELTRDIVELVAREEDLLRRGRGVKSLEGKFKVNVP